MRSIASHGHLLQPSQQSMVAMKWVYRVCAAACASVYTCYPEIERWMKVVTWLGEGVVEYFRDEVESAGGTLRAIVSCLIVWYWTLPTEVMVLRCLSGCDDNLRVCEKFCVALTVLRVLHADLGAVRARNVIIYDSDDLDVGIGRLRIHTRCGWKNREHEQMMMRRFRDVSRPLLGLPRAPKSLCLTSNEVRAQEGGCAIFIKTAASVPKIFLCEGTVRNQPKIPPSKHAMNEQTDGN